MVWNNQSQNQGGGQNTPVSVLLAHSDMSKTTVWYQALQIDTRFRVTSMANTQQDLIAKLASSPEVILLDGAMFELARIADQSVDLHHRCSVPDRAWRKRRRKSHRAVQGDPVREICFGGRCQYRGLYEPSIRERSSLAPHDPGCFFGRGMEWRAATRRRNWRAAYCHGLESFRRNGSNHNCHCSRTGGGAARDEDSSDRAWIA